MKLNLAQGGNWGRKWPVGFGAIRSENQTFDDSDCEFPSTRNSMPLIRKPAFCLCASFGNLHFDVIEVLKDDLGTLRGKIVEIEVHPHNKIIGE